jgi:hypothetical protein
MFWSKKPEVKPTIYTEETCNSCSERARRPFEVGDNVYEQGRACIKCSSSTTVTAVYGVYPPEKPKA